MKGVLDLVDMRTMTACVLDFVPGLVGQDQ